MDDSKSLKSWKNGYVYDSFGWQDHDELGNDEFQMDGVVEKPLHNKSPSMSPPLENSLQRLLDPDGEQHYTKNKERHDARVGNENVFFGLRGRPLSNSFGHSNRNLEQRTERPTERRPSSEPIATLHLDELANDEESPIENPLLVNNMSHPVKSSKLPASTLHPPIRVRAIDPKSFIESDTSSREHLRDLSVSRPILHMAATIDNILSDLGLEAAKIEFKNHNVSDFWLPLPKQTLRHFLKDNLDLRNFFELQDQHIDKNRDDWIIQKTGPRASGFHAAFEDGDEIFHVQRLLGEGAFGVVEEVSLPASSGSIMCVRKKISRPRQLKAQKQIMTAFAREISVMREVDHPHCVRLLKSYTDLESVNILLQPVADTDLATFLDQPLTDKQKKILYKGIHCLCNALHYLHQKSIRHEDLKPQNVLIHGENILLTDFGFSLDFSDDSISTTTGRPSAWTIRYSAPETLDFEPRNRASDIFSLGCILYEMISAIDGHRLFEVKNHWKRYGNGQSSFARNPDAACHYMEPLPSSFTPKALPFLRDYTQFMLNHDRRLRPSAQQVVDRLSDLSLFFDNTLPDIPCCEAPWPPYRKLVYTSPWFEPGYFFYPPKNNGWAYILLDIHFTEIVSLPDFYSAAAFEDFPAIRVTSRLLYLDANKEMTKECWNAHTIRKTHQSDLVGEEIYVETSAKLLSMKSVPFRHMDTLVSIPLGTDSSKLSLPVHKRTIQISLLPICFPRSPFDGAFFYMLSFPLYTEDS